MNQSMWAHSATQANCKLLTDRGVIIVGPEEGSQACGEFGYGRMCEVDSIVNALRLHDVHQLLQGQRVLITAGPTREAIDPVRYISNQSSGKMGYALAAAASMAGAQVTLISGPSALTPPPGALFCSVESAQAMLEAVMHYLEPGMIFIGTAAVADYHVQSPAQQKLKKRDNPTVTLHLAANPDILSWVVESRKASFVVGFAAETSDVLRQAKEKWRAKKVDMMVANQVGNGLGFDLDGNQLTVLTKAGEIELMNAHKMRLAAQVIAILVANLQNVAPTLS
jgi:phosphopantothenoylcysteine decarboxylase/phosphopantothenate--cysteine ligase